MRRLLIGTATLAAGTLLLAAAPDPAPNGEALFAANCAACHQPEGQGVPGAFPALAGDAFVQGPAPAVAATLVHGRHALPAFGPTLSDAEIAAVLTFVRRSWGNAAPPIDPATVAATRHATATP